MSGQGTRYRKRLVAALLMLVAALAIVACGGDDEGGSADGTDDTAAASGSIPSNEELDGRTLVIGTWGGLSTDATTKHLVEPFEKETGVTVKFDVQPSGVNAPLRQQVETGNVRWDLAEGTDSPKALERDDMLERFPDELIDEFMKTSKPEYISPYIIDEQKAFGLIVCNPEAVEKCPKNAKEFWDVENFPGTRGMVPWPEYAFTYALQAAGKSTDEVYPMDLDLAVEKLNELKPHIRAWPDSGTQQSQLLISGEVGMMAGVYLGSGAVVAVEQNPDLEVSFEGAPLGSGGGFVVPKDAPNKDVAFAFLRWVAQHPEAQAAWSDMTRYPMPAKNLKELVKPETARWLPDSHENIQTADVDWVIENLTEMQRRFQEVVGG